MFSLLIQLYMEVSEALTYCTDWIDVYRLGTVNSKSNRFCFELSGIFELQNNSIFFKKLWIRNRSIFGQNL